MEEKDPYMILMLSQINIIAIGMLMYYSLEIKDYCKVKVCGEDACELMKLISEIPEEEREDNDYFNKIFIMILLMKASADFNISPVMMVI